jgi:signal transduction histidine kinase
MDGLCRRGAGLHPDGNIDLSEQRISTANFMGVRRLDSAQRAGHSGGLSPTLAEFFSIGAFVAGGMLDEHQPQAAIAMDVENISRENLWNASSCWLFGLLCCYGIQVLFEKQKRAEAEATEFAVRQERLRTAGRLAAEIAHQIKIPLGIITNAAFCLNRAVHEGETAVDEQIQIIREEVDRADQIITELMGYAQLAEGKVERLDVAEELDAAVQEVFPPAAKYQVRFTRITLRPCPRC